ncbi:unnamed protein product [Rotaria sp. Silwood1]|nr:unnamed protein product [Rotaria sp. Silwood1]CAF4920058.1 unnamed protein product [Rotaria sp. Silwood1]
MDLDSFLCLVLGIPCFLMEMYISKTKYSSSTSTKSPSKDRGTFIFIWLIIICSQALSISCVRLDYGSKIIANKSFIYFLWISFNISLYLMGILLRKQSIEQLGKWFTTVIRTDENQKLIDFGWYKKMRHPSYADQSTTSSVGYTNYQEISTDNCTGSTSICTQELPFDVSKPPDVWLDARITVSTIELNVNNIQARLNLDARVASLVNLTAGVSVGISAVQLKIRGVNAQVQLAVVLDKIADIINTTLQSIDLNPILAEVITGVRNTANQLL